MSKVKHNSFYRPELDMLRFFAFLCVFVHHIKKNYGRTAGVVEPGLGLAQTYLQGHLLLAALWKAMHWALASGVSLFFFLSAYLITTLLMMEIKRTGTIHIGSFYARRALRIWPLYFTYLLVTVGIGWLVPSIRMQISEFVSYVLFYGNWYCVQHKWDTVILAGMLWSISIEEQFYLLCPWSVILLKRKGLAVMSVLVLAVSCGTLYWLGSHGIFLDSLLRPNTLVQMMFLVGGTLTALFLWEREMVKISIPVRLVLVLLGLAAWFYGYLRFSMTSLLFVPSDFAPMMNYLLVLVGVLLIFFAFLGLESRWVSPRLVYLGQISYGLYMWHILAFWLVGKMPGFSGHLGNIGRPLLSFGLTLSAAAISYKWLETPFLLLKDRFAFIKTRAHRPTDESEPQRSTVNKLPLGREAAPEAGSPVVLSRDPAR